jgi:hypothetical protein
MREADALLGAVIGGLGLLIAAVAIAAITVIRALTARPSPSVQGAQMSPPAAAFSC